MQKRAVDHSDHRAGLVPEDVVRLRQGRQCHLWRRKGGHITPLESELRVCTDDRGPTSSVQMQKVPALRTQHRHHRPWSDIKGPFQATHVERAAAHMARISSTEWRPTASAYDGCSYGIRVRPEEAMHVVGAQCREDAHCARMLPHSGAEQGTSARAQLKDQEQMAQGPLVMHRTSSCSVHCVASTSCL